MSVRLCENEDVQTWELSQPADAYMPIPTLLGDAVRLLAGYGSRLGTVKLSGPTVFDDGSHVLLVFVSVDQ